MIGRQLAAATTINQVGCEEIGISGVSMQASFTNVDGRRLADPGRPGLEDGCWDDGLCQGKL
jgi:hypothetical protein